jgi:radical SAM superfamily enzyme YgiQ (UPF0313 family)
MTYSKFHVVLVALYGFEALGVRALHAYLKQHNYDVDILFFRDRLMNQMPSLTSVEVQMLVETLKTLRPNLIGISLFSALFKDVKALTRTIQTQLGVPVIWGGYHPTIVPEDCIEVADFVCIG